MKKKLAEKLDFDYFEYSFLSNCYENDVDDILLISNIILKYILDKGVGKYKVSQIKTDLSTDYGLTIPSTIVETAVKRIVKEYIEFKLEDEVLIISIIPISLDAIFTKSSTEFDSNIRKIRDTFNKFINNQHFNITQSEIIHILDKIKINILEGKPIDANSDQKEILFFDWIHYLYNSNYNSDIQMTLNKILYSLLIYYYFIEYNSSKKDFSKFSIIIDTNVIMHLLGINGLARKKVSEEFLELVKINGAKLIVSYETLNELKEVIKKEPNLDVKNFKVCNQIYATQIMENTKEFVKSLLEKYDMSFTFDTSSRYANKEKNVDWESLYSSLDNYKRLIKYSPATENSIEHDINLIFISGIYKPIYNFFDHFTPIATGDQKLINWFSEELEKRFQVRSNSLIPLYKFTLLLWREGNSKENSKFIGNTWAFIADNITYFKKESSNNLFKIYRDMVQSSIHPSNWKSTYLVVWNNIPIEDDSNKNIQDPEKNIIRAIQLASKEIDASLSEKIEILGSMNKKLLEKNSSEVIEEIKKTNKMNNLFDLLKNIISLIKTWYLGK
jgi:predicted nucleic acid-binding protein